MKSDTTDKRKEWRSTGTSCWQSQKILSPQQCGLQFPSSLCCVVLHHGVSGAVGSNFKTQQHTMDMATNDHDTATTSTSCAMLRRRLRRCVVPRCAAQSHLVSSRLVLVCHGIQRQPQYAHDERRTTNDERRRTGDQRPTTNDQRPTTNDQRATNGRPTTNDQRPTTNDQRRRHNDSTASTMMLWYLCSSQQKSTGSTAPRHGHVITAASSLRTGWLIQCVDHGACARWLLGFCG